MAGIQWLGLRSWTPAFAGEQLFPALWAERCCFPAKAGIQWLGLRGWTPAFAGEQLPLRPD